MLIDIDPIDTSEDPILAMIAGVNGRSARPERIAQGIYTVGHWNFDSYFRRDIAIEEYPDLCVDGAWFNSYGVCDSAEQFLGTDLGEFLKTSERRFVVSLVNLKKTEQPPDGG